LPELARMGVGPVSIPVASILVAHKALSDFFRALRASKTGILVGQTQWLSSFQDYTAFIGLPEYRALEDLYLPQEVWRRSTPPLNSRNRSFIRTRTAGGGGGLVSASLLQSKTN
jgi:hypothetical protein